MIENKKCVFCGRKADWDNFGGICNSCYHEIEYENIIQKHDKNVLSNFANKIKNHMIGYCQGRLDQQYCASEVIDYIGKLLGENDFSINVKNELEKHDKQIRDEVIEEFIKYLKKYTWWSSQADENVIGEFALEEYAEVFKQMKGEQNE